MASTIVALGREAGDPQIHSIAALNLGNCSRMIGVSSQEETAKTPEVRVRLDEERVAEAHRVGLDMLEREKPEIRTYRWVRRYPAAAGVEGRIVYEFLEYQTQDVMTREPMTIAPDASLRAAEEIFEQHDSTASRRGTRRRIGWLC